MRILMLMALAMVFMVGNGQAREPDEKNAYDKRQAMKSKGQEMRGKGMKMMPENKNMANKRAMMKNGDHTTHTVTLKRNKKTGEMAAVKIKHHNKSKEDSGHNQKATEEINSLYYHACPAGQMYFGLSGACVPSSALQGLQSRRY